MLTRQLNFVSTLCSLAFFIGHAAAQAKPPEPPAAQVDIAFLATDEHGRPLSGVTAADLQILDDNRSPTTVAFIRTRSELPVHLGMVLDASNSERASSLFEAGLQGAWEFLNRTLNDSDDKLFIEKFHHLPEATPFMTKRQLLSQKVDLTPEGGTALYDALALACNDRFRKDSKQPALRVLVLLSDGDDDQSHTTREKAIAAAQAARVVVFAISTQDENNHFSYGGASANGTLQQIAEKTGGMAFLHLSRKDIPKVFATIGEQINSMYLVSYTVPDPGSGRSVSSRRA